MSSGRDPTSAASRAGAATVAFQGFLARVEEMNLTAHILRGTRASQSGFPLKARSLTRQRLTPTDTGTTDMSARKSSANRNAVADRQRDVQAEVAAADRNKSKKEESAAMQAGPGAIRNRRFQNSTSQSPARKRGLTPSPCTMRRSTSAQKSLRERWP